MRRTETDSHVEKLRCVSVKHSHIYIMSISRCIVSNILQVILLQVGLRELIYVNKMFYFQFQTAVDI